jgi:hypothetical protein
MKMLIDAGLDYNQQLLVAPFLKELTVGQIQKARQGFKLGERYYDTWFNPDRDRRRKIWLDSE